MVKYSGADTMPWERQTGQLVYIEGWCLERARQEVAAFYRRTWVMAGALAVTVGGLLASYAVG